MIRLAAFLGLLGLFGATAVIAWSGYQQVLDALMLAGMGIVWTSLFHLLSMLACILGWQALLPGRVKASKAFFFYIHWIRSSINNLMPVARIGGEIVSVRLMMKSGVRKTSAIASTVVEITTSIVAQFVFVLFGIGAFLLHVSDKSLSAQLLGGAVVTLPLIGALVYVQRVGFFGLFDKMFTMLFRDKWRKFAGGGAKLDHAVRTTYRRTGKTFYCFVMQLISWILNGVEIWMALQFLGHPLSLMESFMIEALIEATWSAAFMIPGALGVQEAGFLLFGGMLGLTPEIAAALALMRRCRDLLLYVPGLLAWQAQESHWLVQKSKEPRKPPKAA